MWESSDRREAPTFSIYEKIYDTYTDKPVFGGVSSCTLTFYPVLSWFGGGEQACGQATAPEEHAEVGTVEET